MNVLLDSINYQIVKKFSSYKLNEQELEICFKFYSFLNMPLINSEIVTTRDEFKECIRYNLEIWDARINEHQRDILTSLSKLGTAKK
jgi:hypothetical protein